MALHVLRRFRFHVIFVSLVLFCSLSIVLLILSTYNAPDPRRCFTEQWPPYLDEEEREGEHETGPALSPQQQLQQAGYQRLEDVLLSSERPIPGRSIFFHDTTCRQPVQSVESLMNFIYEAPQHTPPRTVNVAQLTARQACAIESAALHNPNFSVFVLFAKPAYLGNATTSGSSQTLLNTILSYSNVQLRNVNLWTYAAGTPLYDWLKRGELFKSQFVLSHTSDFLRYVTLYRWGGLYLDLDTVTLRSMEDLPPNYTGAESDRMLAAGIMNFAPTGFGHEVATRCLYDFQQRFNGKDWGNNGPGVITRVLLDICGTRHIALMTSEPQRCAGFRVFEREAFYAIPWPEWAHFFEPQYLEATLGRIRQSYVAHVWNNFSKKRPLKMSNDSAYGKLASMHCPRVYAAAGEYF